jgi:phage shock protein C
MNGRRLQRDVERRWIGGVCAGLANYLTVPVFFVRLCALPLVLTPLLPLSVVAYVVACLAIPAAPERTEPVDTEREEFRRSALASPSATFRHVRHQMRELEHRIRRMEAYVTSPGFDIDQQLGAGPGAAPGGPRGRG